MKTYLSSILLLICFTAAAQTPDEALRTAWFTQNGSARNMATGGVMGSLGGDITANHVNPAGLGLFKTREFVLTPGFALNNNKLNYRGTDTAGKKNAFNYGTSGIVFGAAGRPRSKWTSSAFAISVNQVANYNNRIQFKGLNNVSSFSEQYLEELIRDRADTNAALSNYIFGSSLAFRTYLIDTETDAGGNVIGFQSLVPISTGVIQRYDATTRGGYNEVALGLAGNMEDKLYVGGSLTIPIINYQRDLVYSETDATNNPSNDFQFFEYKETFTSKGIGVGAKLGVIYKPQEFWRIGFAFHTPQLMTFTDRIRSSMTTNTEGYAPPTRTESSDNLNSGNAGERKYDLTTPWRAIASASYVFREIVDTRRQRAFISADLEYVNYRGARFSAVDNNNTNLVNYYSQVNEAIKDTYKGNINFRIGGELKLHTIMFRLGGAYYGSPYKDDAIDASRLVASGGVGYRDHGIFIDLTYAHTFMKDAEFAYRLNDKPNTFAEQMGSRGNVVLTLGFKF